MSWADLGTWLALVLLSSGGAAADAAPEKFELDYKQGYVVIDTDVRRTVSDWRLEGKVSMGRLPIGRNIQLIKMRPGSYQWTEISVPHYDLPHNLDLSDDKRWAFKVERHKINYFGTLIVGEDRGSKSVDARLVNRTAEILEMLRDQFPEQTALYDIKYAGTARDDFLELVQVSNSDAQAD